MSDKICKKCGQEKAADQFYRHCLAKDGRTSTCKRCHADGKSAWRKANRERHRENRRLYYALNKQRIIRKRNYSSPEKRAAWVSATPRLILGVSLRNAAKNRNQIVTATVDDLMAIWRAQDGKCAISGMTMTWAQGKLMPRSLSIDRIDSRTGYVPGNIRLVCFSVNAFRQQMTDEELYDFASAIVFNMKKPKLRLVS